MPRVYVQFAGMKQLGDAWTAVGSQISEIQGSFSKTVQNLDWDIKCQSDISATASRLSGNMENYFQALQGYRTFFQQAYDAYQKLDQNDTSHKVAPGSASGGWRRPSPRAEFYLKIPDPPPFFGDLVT